MRIDNFTRDHRTGNVTTHIRSGHTLVHAPECKLYTERSMGMVDFETCCDCYISQISLVALADGTVTAIPGQMMHDLRNAASINEELRQHMVKWRRLALIVGGIYALDVGLSFGRWFGWW